MTTHSPEPWSATGLLHDETARRPRRTKKTECPGLFDANGKLIADAAIGRNYAEEAAPISPDNLRRIVACVNACRGYDTATLELWGQKKPKDRPC